MLKLPAFKTKQFETGETITIFQDDAKFWIFYLIPGFPTVRFDPNHNPVFQLIKYKFSDESREEHADLPRGGGFMVFDAELMVKADQRTAAVDRVNLIIAIVSPHLIRNKHASYVLLVCRAIVWLIVVESFNLSRRRSDGGVINV